MRWIALAIAVYAITLWAHSYAHDWKLPNWLGHIAYDIMFSAAVIGIFKPSS